MSEAWRIERVGAESAARLASLHAASFAGAWPAASMASLVSGPGGFALIARDYTDDQGFILLQHVPPEAELLSVGVHPRVRRQGLGAQLIRRSATELAALGGDIMFLDVATDNGAALALYRHLGFKDMARRRGYYGGATDAIVMKASLADIVG